MSLTYMTYTSAAFNKCRQMQLRHPNIITRLYTAAVNDNDNEIVRKQEIMQIPVLI